MTPRPMTVRRWWCIAIVALSLGSHTHAQSGPGTVIDSGTVVASSNVLVGGTGYTAAVGDSFTLMDWSGVVTANGFSTGTNYCTGGNAAGNEENLDLPDITRIGLWQISDLLNGGELTITVVAVPEPTKGMLALVGVAGLVMRRRRR